MNELSLPPDGDDRAEASIRFDDLSANPRLPVLVETMRDLSQTSKAEGLFERLLVGMRKAYGHRAVVALSVAGLQRGQYRITRWQMPEGEDVVGLGFNGDVEALPINEGGFLGGVIDGASPKLIHELELHTDAVVGSNLRGFRSMMALPAFENGVVTNWVCIFERQAHFFEQASLEDSLLRVNLLQLAIRQHQMTARLDEAHRQIQMEVERIAELQRALLPPQLPKIPGVELVVSYETFDRAGGDLYDLRPLTDADDGPWGILVGDASGHGPSSTVLMAVSQMLHRANRTDSPAAMLRAINGEMTKIPYPSGFVTAFYGIYEPTSRTLRYAAAGHPPPLLKRSAGEPLTKLDVAGGVPLGVMDGWDYDEATIDLNAGETLLLFTDGLEESIDAAGEAFGHDRLCDAFAAAGPNAHEAIAAICTAVQQFLGPTRPADDQTVLAMHLGPAD